MKLNIKKSWEIDKEDKEIHEVLKDFLPLEKLKQIFSYDKREFEKWKKEHRHKTEAESFLHFLVDEFNSNKHDEEEIIKILVENKEGYFNYGFSYECDWNCILKEYDLSDFILKDEVEKILNWEIKDCKTLIQLSEKSILNAKIHKDYKSLMKELEILKKIEVKK